MCYARAKNRSDEQSFERFFTVEYVIQQPADNLVVVDVPIIAELRRHVEDIVKFAEQTDRAVLHHRDIVITQSRDDDPLAHILFVEVLR